MSRVIAGLWSVLMVWHEGSREVFDHFGPETYDECARLLFIIGLGVPWEGHRVERAMIVGPVSA